MSTHKLILLGSALLSTVLLGGCCGKCVADEDKKPETPGNAVMPDTIEKTKAVVEVKNPLLDNEWILISESLPGFNKTWTKPENPISIKFNADGSAAGNSSVNRYNTKFTANADNTVLKFSPIASTRMMGPTLKLEMLYFDTLGKVTAYKIQDEKLIFLNGETIVAEFTQAKAVHTAPDTAGIKNVVWVLDLNSLTGADKNWTKPAEPITLTIGSDGKVAGCAGVNRYFGNPQLDEKKQSLKLDNLGCTMMMGPGAEYETKYLQTIAKADKYLVSPDGKSMNLLNGDQVLAKFNKQ